MLESLVEFFQGSFWNTIGNIFTAIGVLSTFFSIIRFIHNARKKRWNGNVSIKDYPADYDVEMEFRNTIYSKVWEESDSLGIATIVFRPIDCVIPKLKVIQLDENGKSGCIVETFHNLTPDDAVCFRLERAECIARYKIRWYSDFGEYSEHFFQDNLRNGINTVNGAEYHTSFLSAIRKALGLY